MDMEAYSIALYVASFVLIVNGMAELIGSSIKEKGEWKYKKHATALIKIIFGTVLLIIAVILWFINVD